MVRPDIVIMIAVQEALKNGPDGVRALTREQSNSYVTMYGGNTIHVIAEFGSPEQLTALMEKVDDVDQRVARRNNTALHFAVMGRNMGTAQVLFALGADIDAVDSDGATPTTYALGLYHPEFVTAIEEERIRRRDAALLLLLVGQVQNMNVDAA